MGHDGGSRWSKFVMDNEHNRLGEVKGGNQNIGANHCSFKLMMDKSLSGLPSDQVFYCGEFLNPLPDLWMNKRL